MHLSKLTEPWQVGSVVRFSVRGTYVGFRSTVKKTKHPKTKTMEKIPLVRINKHIHTKPHS